MNKSTLVTLSIGVRTLQRVTRDLWGGENILKVYWVNQSLVELTTYIPPLAVTVQVDTNFSRKLFFNELIERC